MDSTRPEPTPQQAREQLAATQGRVLSSSRDRRVHAVGTAVVGVTIAAYGAAQTIVSGAAEVAFSVAFFALIFGQAWWVERAARTVPRRPRRRRGRWCGPAQPWPPCPPWSPRP